MAAARKQTVLLLGKRCSLTRWPDHVMDALPDLPEIDLQMFYLNHHNVWEQFSNKVRSTLQSKRALQQIIADRLAEKLRITQPDLVLIVDLLHLESPVRQVLEQHKSQFRVLQWVGDFFSEKLPAANPVVDKFFVTDATFLDDARRVGLPSCHYLPLATNPAVFYPPDAASLREPYLLFVGTHSKNREAVLREINAPLAIYGKGWMHRHLPQAKVIDGRRITITQVADLYRRHQFVINVPNLDNVRGSVNMRCFDAPACGAVLVTPECPYLLQHLSRDEAIYFRSPRDIGGLLDVNCQEIVERAVQRIAKEHTYACRIRSMLHTEQQANSTPGRCA